MNMTAAMRTHAELLAQARASLEEYQEYRPTFPITLGWAQNYDQVFSNQVTQSTGGEDLLERPPGPRRILITGKGGGGKSVLLVRVARAAAESGELPIIVDLGNWTAEDNEFWFQHRHATDEIVHFVLRRFSAPAVATFELNLCSGVKPSLLIVDGLSEVEADIGDSILTAVDDLLITLPGTRLIVADRLVRRDLDERRWRLAALLPLTENAVVRVLQRAPAALSRYEQASEQQRELLQSPYFLHRFLEGTTALAANRSAEQHHWFSVHASLTDPELRATAHAAFRFYRESHSRTFPLTRFSKVTSGDVVRKLRAAGALLVHEHDDLAWFDHQLKHDYLAARYLALDNSRWDNDAFDTVTLHANSFDVLGLVLEQLEESGDNFVRRVYNWNPYGAAYVVAENRARGLKKVSRPMEIVIQAVTAERRFQLMLRTIQQAEDALRVIPTPESDELLDATDLDCILSLVEKFSFEDAPWFSEWKSVFTRPRGETADDAELATVREEDSILGWTYANVAKRLNLVSRQQHTLRNWMRNGSTEVRWRIVHILGAFPEAANVSLLFDVLNQLEDQWRWIRYGATRSLVELAARDPDGGLRADVMRTFASRARALLNDPHSVREFERAVLILPQAAPADWADQVKVVLVELYKASSSGEEKDRWLKLADDVEIRYQNHRANAHAN